MDVITEIMVTARFPAELELQCRVTAATHRISRSELIRRAVERYLREPTTATTANHEPVREVRIEPA